MNYTYFKGFTLIEVLLSLLLLTFVLLGFDQMALNAVRETKNAYFFDTATHQIQNLSERLIALSVNSGLEMEMNDWNTENKSALPGGHGVIEGSYPLYTMMLYWGGFKGPCLQIKIGPVGCIKNIIRV